MLNVSNTIFEAGSFSYSRMYCTKNVIITFFFSFLPQLGNDITVQCSVENNLIGIIFLATSGRPSC